MRSGNSFFDSIRIDVACGKVVSVVVVDDKALSCAACQHTTTMILAPLIARNCKNDQGERSRLCFEGY